MMRLTVSLIRYLSTRQCARRFFWIGIGLILWFGLVSLPVANAAPFSFASQEATDLAHQPAIAVSVELGNVAGELHFFPNTFEFKSGKRYKLLLSNPSPVKHYFTAKDFADSVWNQKVEAGNVEIKGAIQELELKPGAVAEWIFVPVKSGDYELRCIIPGHTEAGMTGQLTVSA
jgi:uncharacterized cupredoxin-like copper-binding protein